VKRWALANGEMMMMQSREEIVVFAEHGCIRDGGMDDGGGKASGQLLQRGWLQLR